MAETVKSCTLTLFTNPDTTGLTGRWEETARRALHAMHGLDATAVYWHWAPAHDWTDPETGHDLRIPQTWHVTAEAHQET